MNADDFLRKLKSDQIPPLVCLYGEETFLVRKALEQLRQCILPGGKDDFNDSLFQGKDLRAEQVIDAAQTLPMFAERRLVTIRDAHLMPVAEQEKLLAYLDNPVPETCLLLIADKIDSRRKFFQQFKKKGQVVEFKPLTERELPDYLKKLLSARNVEISADALNLFCSMVSTGLNEVHSELEKLLTFIGAATLIDVKDVRAVVSRGRAENVFEIGNAVGRGDIGKALSLVSRLSAAGEAPLKILSLVTRHFRQLWKVRELSAKRANARDIASQVRIPYFVVEGLIQQAGKFSRNDFIHAYELFLETDLAMKSSGANSDALLEQLLHALVAMKNK